MTSDQAIVLAVCVALQTLAIYLLKWRNAMVPAVALWPNGDGTWTARIFSQTFTGTRQECVDWVRANGETI